MTRIGILTCDRERTCIGGKCFKAVQERAGVFQGYSVDEPLEVVGFIPCGGCPGERLEKAPAEMKKYGADVIVLASCFLAGYPPCPYLRHFIGYIRAALGIPVIVGSHPMPTNYIMLHSHADDWPQDLEGFLGPLVNDAAASDRYDSTRPSFLMEKV
jgi:predicted metal-binding protein